MSYSEDKLPAGCAIMGFLGILAIIGIIALAQASFEADAYRRLTGKNVTTWDAIWLDLRVNEEIKERKNDE